LKRSLIPVSILTLLALCAVAALAAASPRGTTAGHGRFDVRAVVHRVVEGDTLGVTLAGGRHQRLRLIGIDTPDVRRLQCFGVQARTRARGLAQGKRVRLIGDAAQRTRDRSGRLLAYVVLPRRRDLARQLIAEGFGRVHASGRAFRRLLSYRRAERSARSRGRGLWTSCAAQPQPPPPSPPSPPPPPSAGRTVVWAVGDGADGSATSAALAGYIKAQNPERFFYLGDVYESGTASEFAKNYEPLYGSMAGVTDPVIGNHESGNRSTGYYPYWQGKRGWTAEQARHRSYIDAASGWQIIAYSSEENMAAEGAWVGGEVAKHAGTCRIVMAHHGRHVVVDSSHGDNAGQDPVWSAIRNKTAINLVAHNHVYGRLQPLDGVTVIVSGAGGHGLRSLGTQHHAVAASKTGVATATRLVLRRGAAEFSQVDSSGTVYDSGTITCSPA
jgi:endonuclease YncB( thermonuclease family)